MRSSHFLCLAAGAGAVALVALASKSRPELQARVVQAPRVATDPRLEEVLARLDRLALRLDQIAERAARLDRLEQELAEIRARPPATVILESSPRIPIRQRVRALALTRDADRAPDALEAWRMIEESTVDPKRRAEALFEQGQIYVKLEDWDSAAESFRKVVELIGLGGARGQTAAHRWGLSEAKRGDNTAAYKAFRRLCDAPHLSKTAEPTYRIQMAVFASASGDVETARREYQRFIADYENTRSKFHRKFVKHAREWLKKNG